MVLRKVFNFLTSWNSFTFQQWSIFIVFSFANCLAGCVNSVQAPLNPAEAEKKGATATEYGLVFGVFQIFMFIFSPVFGKHMHYLGAKTVLQVGTLSVGISCCLFGLLEEVMDHIWFISLSFLIRIVEAIGSAGVLTAIFTVIGNEFPNQISSTFALLETFYGLGCIIGPGVGGALYEVGGFILPFMANGASLIILGCAMSCVFPKISTAMDEELQKVGFSLFDVLQIPGAMVSAVSLWVCSNNVGFISATLEPHLRQFSLSQVQIGGVFMTTGMAYAISAPLYGKLIDRGASPKCHRPYTHWSNSLFPNWK